MSTRINDLQNHIHFQLSLLKLVNTQNGAESISAVPPAEITQQQHLQDALTKIADAIY